MKKPKKIICKRAYEEPSADDGYRALVDRIWPRGIKKSELQLDGWYKELAPSTELRKWFNHEPQLWSGFTQKFHKELSSQKDTIKQLLTDCDGKILTLIYAASDTKHNNALALKKYIDHQLK